MQMKGCMMQRRHMLRQAVAQLALHSDRLIPEVPIRHCCWLVAAVGFEKWNLSLLTPSLRIAGASALRYQAAVCVPVHTKHRHLG